MQTPMGGTRDRDKQIITHALKGPKGKDSSEEEILEGRCYEMRVLWEEKEVSNQLEV